MNELKKYKILDACSGKPIPSDVVGEYALCGGQFARNHYLPELMAQHQIRCIRCYDVNHPDLDGVLGINRALAEKLIGVASSKKVGPDVLYAKNVVDACEYGGTEYALLKECGYDVIGDTLEKLCESGVLSLQEKTTSRAYYFTTETGISELEKMK